MPYHKRGLCLAGCIVAWSVPATAADLGRPKTLEPVENRDDRRPALWNGLYGGLTVGAMTSVLDVDKVGSDRDLKRTDAVPGVFVGYNFANNGPWLWGVEADLQSHGFDKKKSTAVAGLGNLSANEAALGSIRLRGGYTWSDVLFYGTAGLALSNVEATSSLGGKTNFKTGLAIGLGAEWAFDKAWTARIEGIGYGFGKDEVVLAGTKRDVGLGSSTLRLGVARRF
jgi:outer membrane immunogenic protein